MRYLATLIIFMLLATAVWGQPYTPEGLPFTDSFGCKHIPLVLPFKNWLAFHGYGKDADGRTGDKILLYNGKDPITEIPKKLLGNVYTSHIVWATPQPQDKLYFVGAETPTEPILYSWDGVNAIQKIASLPKGSTINSMMVVHDSLYFLHIPSQTHIQNVFTLDIRTGQTHNLTPNKEWISALYLFNDNIYYFENKHSDVLHSYSPSTKSFSTINTGFKKEEPIQHRGQCATSDELFLLLETATYGNELFVYYGKNSFKLVADFAQGKASGISHMSQPLNGKIYFSGSMDTSTQYDLYSYDINFKRMRLVKDFSADKDKCSNATDFCLANNRLYFSLYKENHGRQLYQYDDYTKKIIQLTDYKDKKTGIFLYPVNLLEWQDRLYFSPFPPDGMDNADGLFLGPNLTEFEPIYSIPLK